MKYVRRLHLGHVFWGIGVGLLATYTGKQPEPWSVALLMLSAMCLMVFDYLDS